MLHSNCSSQTQAVIHETKGLLLQLLLWRLAMAKKRVGQGALTKAEGFPTPGELPCITTVQLLLHPHSTE